MFISNQWKDYQIIDAGDGEKLERWGNITVRRPDPGVIWPRTKPDSVWQKCHMHYHRSKAGGGKWEHKKKTPDQWTMAYKDLTFNIRPTDFKHMGLFPEQATNWDWTAGLIKSAKASSDKPIKILNLFGYTGGATVSCLNAGASVTHIDAAKGMNNWAKSNIQTSNVEGQNCRIITDDVHKFVQRELRRGSYYDGIMMDPPSYGRGPSGEVWKLENLLYDLIKHTVAILNDKPLFFLLNTYTTGFTATAAENVLKMCLEERDVMVQSIASGPLVIPVSDSNVVLPCGSTVRCKFDTV